MNESSVELGQLLASPRLVASADARADLASGQVRRELVALVAAAVELFELDVRTIKSGHPMGPLSPAGKTNSHYFFCAADIYAIDGCDVAGRPIPEPVVRFGRWLMSLEAAFRPTSVMGPAAWHVALGPGDRRGFRNDEFANRVHDDHVHVGFDPHRTLT